MSKVVPDCAGFWYMLVGRIFCVEKRLEVRKIFLGIGFHEDMCSWLEKFMDSRRPKS